MNESMNVETERRGKREKQSNRDTERETGREIETPGEAGTDRPTGACTETDRSGGDKPRQEEGHPDDGMCPQKVFHKYLLDY